LEADRGNAKGNHPVYERTAHPSQETKEIGREKSSQTDERDRPTIAYFSLKLYPQIEPTGTIETIETIGTTFAPNKRLERSEAVERLERFERSFFTSGTIGTIEMIGTVRLSVPTLNC
jgi:hypothetical protein